MCHSVLVAIASGYGDFIIEAHAVATALFRSEVIQRDTYSADKAAMVSPILLAPINGHRSFFIAPDGSKEGWDISKNGNTARAKFREYLRSLEYADGSTPLKWVEVQYGDDDLVTAIIDDSDATWRNINRRKDEKEMICTQCGQPVRPNEQKWNLGTPNSTYHQDCLGAAIARAEAAEAQLAALQAAGEWRPVDDKPAHGQDVEVCAILTGVWWDDDGIFDVYQVPDEITIKGWRPAPPHEVE